MSNPSDILTDKPIRLIKLNDLLRNIFRQAVVSIDLSIEVDLSNYLDAAQRMAVTGHPEYNKNSLN